MQQPFTTRRIKRPELGGAAISLAIHLLALYLLSREDLFFPSQPPPELTQPLSVNLMALPGKTTPAPVPLVEAKPAIKSPPRTAPPPRKPSPPVKAVSPPVSPDVPAATKATPTPTPAPAKPETPPALDPSQFPDMISYLEAMRQKRREAGEIPAQSGEPPAARTAQDGEDAARMARIQRNLKQSGTNGIFHISSIDARSAVFSFRGWQGEFSYSRREEYQVEAGFDQDIRRVVVRKMIEIIRRYHREDFNWESPRLGRVIVLSARLQDNDGLEDFLIQEFFGPP